MSRIRPSWVRASPSRYTEMASDPRITAVPTGSRRRKKIFRQAAMVWSAARRLPRARCWEVRLDTAEVSPTAVRDRSTEYTGITS